AALARWLARHRGPYGSRSCPCTEDRRYVRGILGERFVEVVRLLEQHRCLRATACRQCAHSIRQIGHSCSCPSASCERRRYDFQNVGLRRNVEHHTTPITVEGLKRGVFAESEPHGQAAERATRARGVNVHAPSGKVERVNRW